MPELAPVIRRRRHVDGDGAMGGDPQQLGTAEAFYIGDNSGMAGVAPTWKITGVLDADPVLVQRRVGRETAWQGIPAPSPPCPAELEFALWEVSAAGRAGASQAPSV